MERLGRYEIIAELGRGAMGAVFQARDPKIDRIVAIKTIAIASSDPKDFEEYRHRFFREAQAAGRLSDPGVVTIYDVGEEEDTNTPYIVMEYVSGITLDRLATNPLPLDQVLDLLQQIATALDYAHSQGIVHRDIKPANILVTADGRAKIADFGIAKLTVSEFTVAGKILGTPAYMSPEQLSGRTIDGRSDIFSLGVIAHWLLTTQKPFTGDSATAISFQVVYQEPPRVSQVTPALNGDFDYVVSRALAKEPTKRYQRGRDFAADLEDLRSGKSPRSRQTYSLFEPADGEKTVIQRTQLHAATHQLPLQTQSTSPLIQPTRQVWLKRAKSWVAIVQHRVAITAQAFSRQLPRRYQNVKYVYAAATSILLVILAGVVSLGRGSNQTARLQIVGEHSFRSAEISIWVDDDLRYKGELKGTTRKHGNFFKSTYSTEGSFALMVPVSPGEHTIQVQVESGEEYSQVKSVKRRFLAEKDQTLKVSASRLQPLTLGFED